jgi:fibronectin-binding autotransporter adhesin
MKTFYRVSLITLILAAAVGLMGATTAAIYLHHQRSDLASLEADLQNREIGLDFADKSAVGKFADGTKFHLLSQEMPNAALGGTLNVTGNTTLGATLTLSAQTASRPLWTNGSSQVTTNAPTGSGTALVLQTSPTINTPTISSPTITGATITSPAISNPTISGTLSVAAGTFSGTLGVTGDVTVSNSTGAGAILGLTSTDAGGQAWKIASGGSSGGAYPTGSLTFRNTSTGFSWLTISSVGAAQFPGTLGVTGTVTAAGINLGGTTLRDYLVGTFTATQTGCTTSPTYTVSYTQIGNVITLTIPQETGIASNSTSKTLTGLPAGLQPATTQDQPMGMYDGSNPAVWGVIQIQAGSGTMNLYPTPNRGLWTASGMFGRSGTSITYTLQ